MQLVEEDLIIDRNTHQLVTPLVQEMDISAEAQSQDWFAVYVWSNQEKVVERHLHMRDIETFLPLQTVYRQWKNRVTAKIEIPLFTGYVFVKMSRRQCAKVLEVPAVHSIVGNGRESLALPKDEIEALRTGLKDREAEPHPFIKVGELARIRSGPMAGLKGVVIRVNSQLRVVLSVDAIARSIAVHVSAEELDPL